MMDPSQVCSILDSSQDCRNICLENDKLLGMLIWVTNEIFVGPLNLWGIVPGPSVDTEIYRYWNLRGGGERNNY